MIFGKYLKKYYKKYFIFFLIGIAALVIIDLYHLAIPEYLGDLVRIIEKGYVTGDVWDDVLKLCLKVIHVAGVMFIGRIIFRLSLFHASTGIEAGIRQDLFYKAEKLSLDYYHDNKIGNVVSLFSSDCETIQELFGWGTVMLVDGLFLTVFVFIKMFMLNVPMTLLTMIPVLLIVIWGALVEKYMSKVWNERQTAYDKLYDFSTENFTGIRVIKAFVKENFEIHAFSKIAKENQDVSIKHAKLYVFFDVIIELICTTVVCLILGIGGWFVYAAATGNPISIFNQPVNIKADTLVTFFGYFQTLIWPLIALGQVVTMRSRAKTSYGRIANFLDTPESIVDKENAVELSSCLGSIEFKDFSFKYPSNNLDSLKNISLKINPGEMIGVIGRVGCGKSSLVNSLLRLYNVDEGKIFIDGVDIMSLKVNNLRDQIALVPQDNFLFSDSVKNNICFSDANKTLEEAMDAARFADVHNDVKKFERGYGTISGERGVTLSGGQKQRISIARAFLKNAPILILDDSVSAVDIKTEETILENIKNLRKDKTTIIVSSRLSTVQKLDKIIVLKDGEIEAFDTPENLEKDSYTYKKMSYLQQLEKEVTSS